MYKENDSKKIVVSSELFYVLAISSIALGVAFSSSANLGMSMIAAPTFILWSKFPFLTMGQWEYVVEGLHLLVFCLVVRRFKLIYLATFFTAIFYGTILDLFRLIPLLNPSVTTPEMISMPLRFAMFAAGVILTAFGVACSFHTYLYPQVYDFFVKYVPLEFGLDRIKFKRIYDLVFLAIGTALTLILFRGFVGVTFATLIIALINGPIIGFMFKWQTNHFIVRPKFKKLPEHFLI